MEVGKKVTTTIEISASGLPHPHYGKIMTVERLEGPKYVIVSLDNFNVNTPEYNNRHRYEIKYLKLVSLEL